MLVFLFRLFIVSVVERVYYFYFLFIFYCLGSNQFFVFVFLGFGFCIFRGLGYSMVVLWMFGQGFSFLECLVDIFFWNVIWKEVDGIFQNFRCLWYFLWFCDFICFMFLGDLGVVCFFGVAKSKGIYSFVQKLSIFRFLVWFYYII